MDMSFKNGNNSFRIRFANESDVGLILSFIKELAEYESLLEHEVATEEILRDSLFRRKAAEVIIGNMRMKQLDLHFSFIISQHLPDTAFGTSHLIIPTFMKSLTTRQATIE